MSRFSTSKLSRVLDTHGNNCWYCGIELKPWTINGKQKDSFTIDHLIPISRGGTNEATNLVPTCSFCNTSKGNRTLEEYRQSLVDKQPYGSAAKLLEFAQEILEAIPDSHSEDLAAIIEYCKDNADLIVFHGEQADAGEGKA